MPATNLSPRTAQAATHPRSWRSSALGGAKQLELPRGTLPYHGIGSGTPVLFVHGAMVNANVWRKVVPALASDFRCLALDLPFGGHLVPMPPDADFSPPGLANRIADAIEALELDDVTLVGNDTGGALCQIVIARRPERIGRLVLTSCDAFENFPPKALRPYLRVMLLPGAMPLLFSAFRLRGLRGRVTTMMALTKRPVAAEAADSYFLPLLRRAVRRDTKKLLRGMDERHTREAAERFPGFDRPALIAWSREDRFFRTEFAGRLAGALPNARLEWIDDAYTLASEDQPDRLAELIAGFVREPAGTQLG
jgi:pimeloyl-ACP methyl ester carboxylesterase